jgi:hypothetical protein
MSISHLLVQLPHRKWFCIALYSGRGVARDLAKAAEFFKRAATGGLAIGQSNFVSCLTLPAFTPPYCWALFDPSK